jgi:hypothetical protein
MRLDQGHDLISPEPCHDVSPPHAKNDQGVARLDGP